KTPVKILVCDDDPAFRKLVRTYLRSADMDFVLKEAGQKGEIRDALDKGGIDLVLMDILMPEKSGIEWLDEIVEKRIAPVVMLTGFGSEEIAVQSIHEGAIDYIPKERLTRDRLLSTIKITLETWKRKLAEEEKRRLMEELEAKNEELERFAYSVSHDLKSPLSAIYGYASILREDLERNEIEKGKIHLKRIENGVTLMDKMLSDTLQLSRAGRVVNPPEDVPFGELIEKALEQTEEKIKSRKIKISVTEDFPTVLVDRMRMVEVLVNLITNSINYMGEQPHPKIEIGHRLEGEETVFFVRDNGIGIEPSKHTKVFELFYRIDRSSKGTGAGLAIVRRKIEVHGGRIWIESE
ncbi:MAG: response regulator, partial [Methanophagales archaeon]|nr:response regulator [Methanophagales archaeon]